MDSRILPLTGTAGFGTKRAGKSANDDIDYSDIEPLFECLADADTDEERRERRGQIIVSCLPLCDRIAYRFVGREIGRAHV